jgi:hypothetical protein
MTQGPGWPPQQPQQSWQPPPQGQGWQPPQGGWSPQPPQQSAYGQGWPPPQHPYAQRQHQPQPQPPRRRKKWPWIVGGLVLLLAALIGTAGNSATPDGRTGSSGAPAAPLPPHRAVDAREWQIIAKDPAAHEGERIIVYGRVTQFDAATGNDTFRASVDGIDHPGEKYAFDTNTMLNGDASALHDIVNDDLFRAEVTVSGSLSYGTQIGGNTTVPRLTVDTIKVIGRG